MNPLKGYKVEAMDTDTLRNDLALYKQHQKVPSQIVSVFLLFQILLTA